MGKLPGFNDAGLPRRSFLSGQDPRYRTRFWMQTPMFLRRGGKDVRTSAPGHLHSWVIKADKESKAFRANPDRPRLWLKKADRIVPISERTSGTLHRGDVVAISFTVTYHVNMVNWFAQFHPMDIIVLKDGDVDAMDYSAPALDLHSCPPPSFDAIPEEDCKFYDYRITAGLTGYDNARSDAPADDMLDVQHTTTPVDAGEGIMAESAIVGPIEDGEVGGLQDGDGVCLDESMEVDDSGRAVPLVDADATGLGDQGKQVYFLRARGSDRRRAGFDIVEMDGRDGDQLVEDFVDVTAQEEPAEQEEEKRGTRAGAGRAVRATRKRNCALLAA